ncbi:MAG: pyrimidine-nucleoside phosphorylase, partial [Oligoflexales bacterium]|nr:pyrimidine-nucleoside phosphorylase [Oligoflexales bacterium]
LTDGRKRSKAILESGRALDKFRELVVSQGGDGRVIEDYGLLPMASEKRRILSRSSGYVAGFDVERIGFLCVDLGGGRRDKSDRIDHGTGFVFHKKLGDRVRAGDPLLTVYYNSKDDRIIAGMEEELISRVIRISGRKAKVPPLIYL